MWEFNGTRRPPFAKAPVGGQESVWDYPRPPRLDPDARRVRVSFDGRTVVDTVRAIRVCETASPPTFYLPPDDTDEAALRTAGGGSFCEWKGRASYFDVIGAGGAVAERAAWCYRGPTAAFAAIDGWYAFYPALAECFVDDERVQPQAGGFYGGWVTRELVGPWKGEGGRGGW